MNAICERVIGTLRRDLLDRTSVVSGHPAGENIKTGSKASAVSGTRMDSGSSGHSSPSATGSSGTRHSMPSAAATEGNKPALVAVTATSATEAALVLAVSPCPLTRQAWLPIRGDAATSARPACDRAGSLDPAPAKV